MGSIRHSASQPLHERRLFLQTSASHGVGIMYGAQMDLQPVKRTVMTASNCVGGLRPQPSRPRFVISLIDVCGSVNGQEKALTAL